MARDLNKAMVIGRLGRDPEVRYLANGTAVANLAIATSMKWKDKNTGEMREDTQWHQVEVWGVRSDSLHGMCNSIPMVGFRGTQMLRPTNNIASQVACRR